MSVANKRHSGRVVFQPCCAINYGPVKIKPEYQTHPADMDKAESDDNVESDNEAKPDDKGNSWSVPTNSRLTNTCYLLGLRRALCGNAPDDRSDTDHKWLVKTGCSILEQTAARPRSQQSGTPLHVLIQGGR